MDGWMMDGWLDKWMDGEGGKEKGMEREIYQQTKTHSPTWVFF